MENIITKFKFQSCSNEKRRDKSHWGWIPIVLLIVAVLAVGLTVFQILTHYNEDAEPQFSMAFQFRGNRRNHAASAFTSSAGDLHYGFFQDSGRWGTRYSLEYKRTNRTAYIMLDDRIVITSNDDYNGSFFIRRLWRALRFDVRATRLNHWGTNSTFVMDVFVE